MLKNSTRILHCCQTNKD